MKRWGRVLLWSVVLLAMPAAAQNEQCEEECSMKAGEMMPACLEKCPATQDPGHDRRFQKCAKRCSNAFRSQVDTCKKRCGGKQEDGAGKKQDG